VPLLGQHEAAVMRFRISVWAILGVVIVMGWRFYVSAMAPIPISTEPIAWTLARLSCPVLFASLHFHFPLSFYWILPANATTYALFGLIIETLRNPSGHAKSIS
jgi:hypothetical protein